MLLVISVTYKIAHTSLFNDEPSKRMMRKKSKHHDTKKEYLI